MISLNYTGFTRTEDDAFYTRRFTTDRQIIFVAEPKAKSCTVDGVTGDFFSLKRNGQFLVCEGLTGVNAAYGNTLSKALEMAKDNFYRYGQEGLQSTINKMAGHLSPRWKKNDDRL